MKLHRYKNLIQEMLRVDHAGELGATQIYKGQYSVLRKTHHEPIIKHMWDQEKVHLKKLEEFVVEHRARPSVFYSVWSCLGYMAGRGSALLGPEYAMQLTESVETVIGNHYNDQIRELISLREKCTNVKEVEALDVLIEHLSKFRDEELEHKETAKSEDKSIGMKLFDQAVQMGCKASIEIAKKL